MKIAQDRGVVERSGQFVEKTFQIAATAKAFQVLSSGLYSDKITAIIRELSTNAYDAHVDAGTLDIPFHVHLPSNLEPAFWIRDFGTGLSRKDIEELYTTYFASNKSHSDDFVGCMGLGSKSPFSYIENFTVTSFYNGERYVYNCLLDENGLPTVAFCDERETDEPNGLMIHLAVQPDDFYEFRTKAEDVYQYFKVKPKLIGDSTIMLPEPSYLLQGSNFGLHQYSSRHSKVIMGCVGYAIDSRNLTDLKPAEIEVLNWGVDLYVPIGSVRITANRETLEFKKDTIDTCVKALGEAIAVIKTQAEQEIKDCDNLWEAKLKYNQNKDTIISKVGWASGEMEWQGFKLNESHINFRDYDEQVVLGQEEDEFGEKENGKLPLKDIVNRIPSCERAEEIKFDGRRRNKRTGNRTLTFPKREKVVGIPISSEIKVFINDMDRGGFASVEYYMQRKGLTNHVYVITKPTQYFLHESGLENIVEYTSSLPIPEKEIIRRENRKRNISKLYVYNPESSNNVLSSYWLPEDKDISEGGVYVIIHHFRSDYGGYRNPYNNSYNIISWKHPLDMLELVNDMKNMFGKFPIYGVRANHLPSLQKKGNWVHLKDYVAQKIAQYPAELEALILNEAYNRTNAVSYKGFDWWCPTFEEIDPMFEQLHSFVGQLGMYHEHDTSTYQKLLHSLNGPIPKLNEFVEENVSYYKNLHDAIIKKYPLLPLFQRAYDNYNQAIKEYIYTKNNIICPEPESKEEEEAA